MHYLEIINSSDSTAFSITGYTCLRGVFLGNTTEHIVKVATKMKNNDDTIIGVAVSLFAQQRQVDTFSA